MFQNFLIKKMTSSSESAGRLHPLVARLIQEYACPSPGHIPSDPEQPKRGCLKELKRRRENSQPLHTGANEAKKLLLMQLKLDNTDLNPVSGQKTQLEAPLQSSILRRRGLNRSTEKQKSA